VVEAKACGGGGAILARGSGGAISSIDFSSDEVSMMGSSRNSSASAKSFKMTEVHRSRHEGSRKGNSLGYDMKSWTRSSDPEGIQLSTCEYTACRGRHEGRCLEQNDLQRIRF